MAIDHRTNGQIPRKLRVLLISALIAFRYLKTEKSTIDCTLQIGDWRLAIVSDETGHGLLTVELPFHHDIATYNSTAQHNIG
jgi:hypothetical protein